MMKPTALAMIFGFVFSTPVSALQPQAIGKNGVCPTGYLTSGQYCIPQSGAGYAIEKNGVCPTGYLTSGKYCVGSNNSGHAMHKNGICPTDYVTSGNYCLKR